MAVAVKTSEPRTQATTVPVQLLSLVGLILLVGVLALVFWVIPTYVPGLLTQAGVNVGPYVMATLVGAVMLVAVLVVGLLIRGVIASGVNGVRAGIFTCFAAALGILLLGTWFGGVMEWVTFDRGYFGSAGKMVGIIATSVFSAVLLALFLRWFFSRGTDKWLAGFEDGGWFSWTSYKPQQGNRVRRGTIIGLLLLGGSGVYTMVSTDALARYQQSTPAATSTVDPSSPDATPAPAPIATTNTYDGWTLGVPFTGQLTLRVPTAEEKEKGETGPIGDATLLLKEKAGWDGSSPVIRDRWFFRDEINQYLANRYVYLNLDDPAQFGLQNGVMLRSEWDEAYAKLEDVQKIKIDKEKDTRSPIPAGNPNGRKDPDRLYTSDGNKFVTLSYTSIPLLPHVRFTLPLLLLGLTFWLTWRIVNYPPFADFLIATEAEMNKVSWTNRKRLFQDTIVVLVTLLLMAGFLLIVDLSCKSVLGHSWIRVIQIDPDAATAKKTSGPRPW